MDGDFSTGSGVVKIFVALSDGKKMCQCIVMIPNQSSSSLSTITSTRVSYIVIVIIADIVV